MHPVPRAAGIEARRPAVVVAVSGQEGHAGQDGVTATLRELLAGVEEEGVPFRVERAAEGAAGSIAHDAALASTLGVGIGVDDAGLIAVHHAKLPPGCPALTGDRRRARTLGHNAARLVVGIPFKDIQR
jgi:hypothetical protein